MKIDWNEAIWAISIGLVSIMVIHTTGSCVRDRNNIVTQLKIACLAKGNPPLHCKELR